MQLLRALKLATSAKYTAKRLSLWLYTRVKNLLFYIIRHPIRSIIQFIKIYLVTLLTLMFLAFALSGIVSAQVTGDQSAVMCPLGGTYTDGNCTIPSPSVTKYIIQGYSSGRTPQEACSKSAAAMTSAWLAANPSVVDLALNNSTINTSYRTCTQNFSYTLSSGATHSSSTGGYYQTDGTFNACPPDGQSQFDQGPISIGEQQMCYYPAQPEPECDCRNYAGQALTTANTLIAKKGVYSRENPPQCVTQTENAVGRDEPLTCTCQVSAQKWFSMASGSENERWETLPVQNGQPSGTFTGVKCGEKDGGPLEPEEDAPKECFTLQNGIKWCWANEAEKCARIDGIMTCDTGCGTINGDFVCVESPEDPTLPDPPAVDDDINDPTKTINDMTKADFKEVNKGVEARLDVLAQLMQQANNRPGISMGDTNRALGDLGSKIDALTDAVKEGFAGQEGDEDEDGGGDEEGGSVTYDTDRLTEFANANDWEQRNFGTVLVDMVDRIKETPTFSAASTFFDVSFAAECPIWSTSFTVFSQSFDFTVDQQCSDVMNQTWPWIRAVLLLVFSFLAFRVAYE